MEHAPPLACIGAHWRGALARRSVPIAGLPLYAAIGVAAAAVWVADAGGVPDDHAALGFVVATTVLVLAAAAWLHEKSSRRFALALFALAGVTALVALTAVAAPPVYAIGIAAETAAAALLWWLLLSFPTGRLHGAATYVFGLGIVLLLTTFVPQLLTAPRLEALSPVAWCRSACPRNTFAVTSQPGLADTFARAEAVGLGVLTAILAVLLAYRVTHASSARRRVVLPIYVGAVAALSLTAAVDLAARFGNGPSGVADQLAIADSSAMIFLPFGFLIAIALTQIYAGAALEQMIREVGNSPSVATIERLVRRVLDDPLAGLAFRVPRGRGVVDRHGREVVLDDLRHESWQRFGRPGGETAVAVLHDTDTAESPSLVNAVGAAAVLALENRRLHQELIDTIAALRASRKRIVTVAAAERRKIERDLHDSTQQELVAVRIQLELTRDRADVPPPLAQQLGRIGDDLNEALDRLRSLAHGIYPTLLAERGLGEALEDAARNAVVPVVAEIDDVGRQPEEVETAVYYCCLEALQNASKHAGAEAVVTMRLWRDDGALRFTVVDDGVGFAARKTVATSGLMNLSDRLGAVGGRITVRSALGRGTAVDGMVVVDG